VLAPLARRIHVVPIASERSALPAQVAAACRQASPAAAVTVCASLSEALGLAAEAPAVLITGSIHLVGAALQHLDLVPPDQLGEQRLNEYTMR
jgi:folylpolyglutamate synthase/dihydropteroate synthase